MDQQQLKIYNGKIITPNKVIDGGTILVTGNTITTIGERTLSQEMRLK
jgi:hypothetical protein